MLKHLYGTPATVLIISLLVCIAGIVRFFTLPIALYPNTSRPALELSLSGQTIDPEGFKKQFGNDIEAKLLALKGVEEVEGRYRKGRLRWEVTFGWDVDPEKAQSDVRSALSAFESRFPKDWDSFAINLISNNSAGIYITVASQRYDNEELWNLLQDRLKAPLERIAGIEGVFISKPHESLVKVDLLYYRLLALGLSVDDIKNALLQSEYDHTLPRLTSFSGQSFSLSVPLRARSLADLERLIIKRHGAKLIRLSDVARLSLAPQPPDELIKGNGKRAVMLGANIKPDGNIAQACSEFAELVRAGAKALDPGIDVKVLVNPAEYITEAILNIGEQLLSGILISTLIIFLFLGSLRLTMVIAISIPLSLIGGFIIMSLTGIELNLISLGAMALSVGMVVDGATVVLENIDRHMAMKSPQGFSERLHLIYEAVKEVRAATIISVLTTIIVFAPLPFTAPLAHAILGDLAKVMVCVMIISILVTLLVVPPLMMLFKRQTMKKKQGIYRLSSAFQTLITSCERCYLRFLAKLLHQASYRYGLALVLGGALLGSLWLLTTHVRREILATPDTDKVWLYIEPQNQDVDVSEMDSFIAPYEKIIQEEFGDDLSNFLTVVRSSQAEILCNLKDKRQLLEFKNRLETRFRNTPEVHFGVSAWNPTALQIPKAPLVRLRLSGRDPESKRQALEALIESAQSLDEIGRVESFPRQYKINDYNILFKSENLLYGLGKKEALSFRSEVESLIGLAARPQKIREIHLEDEREPLPLELGFSRRLLEDPQDIKNLFIQLEGKILPLRHYVEITPTQRWAESYTERGQEAFKLEVNVNTLTERDKGSVEKKLREVWEKNPDIDKKMLVFDDPQREINANIYSLIFALGLALALIWTVISVQFGNVWQTLVIMGAIPLGFIGVALSLYVFDSTLSVNSMLGLILLCGIAVNNSIIYVDFYRQIRANSPLRPLVEVLLETARLRFRPILITVATTILGMLPLAFGLGSGGEILQPLGIAVCAGLGISTVLTLLVVPLLLFWGADRQTRPLPPALLTLTLCCFFVGAAAGGAQLAYAEVEVLSLPRVEARALEQDLGLQARSQARQALLWQRRSQWAALLPRLTWSQTLNLGLNDARGQSRQFEQELELTEAVPNPVHFSLELDRLQLREEIHTEETAAARLQVLTAVRHLYLSALLLDQQVQNAEENLVLLNKSQAENERRYAAGFIDKGDLLKSQANQEKFAAEAEVLKASFGQAKAKLLQAVSIPSSAAEVRFAGSLALQDQTFLLQWQLGDLEKRLAASPLRLQQLHSLKRQQSDLEVAQARWHFFPELSLSASFPVSGDASRPRASYTASLTWPLFSGGQSYYDYQQKVALAQQELLLGQQAVLAAQLRRSELLGNLENTKLRLIAQQKAVLAWRALVTTAQSRYASGQISYKDLSDELLTYVAEKDKLLLHTYTLATYLVDFSQELGQSEAFYEFFTFLPRGGE